MTQAITALFDDRAHAGEALRALLAAGFARGAIVVLPEEGGAAVEGNLDRAADRGLWASLKDLFAVERERHAYAEGLRRGGFTVSVRAEDDRADAAIDAMEASGAVDFAERQVAWRAEGWDAEGWSAPAAPPAPRAALLGPARDDPYDGAGDLAGGDTGYASGVGDADPAPREG